MPINRYQIRNVYSLADPEVYKAADRDDPEALLEGVAMAGLVGVLRQLGDLAEFAAAIFHDLHEEVMATAARGHGLLVRVEQLEFEIPEIERAFLSQTSHSAFFPNPGIHWHPNQQTTQNLIITGDIPRFVMNSYEECRGPPRLFLLDKFDVGGAGACLKRYTDPSFFKVEASSYDIESAETQRDKKTRKRKKKGSRWKRGETPEVSQPSHAKLHQLFLEEQVQTGATEPARRVKLKKRPNKFPLDVRSGKSYMIKFLNSPLNDNGVDEIPTPADTSNNGSRLEILEDNGSGSTLCSPIQSTASCVSSSVNKHITIDEEIKTNGVENGSLSDDVASETDNYMDALATIDSELETEAKSGPKTTDHRTYSDAKSDENISPVGVGSPPCPYASTEIPFHPRVSPKQPVSIAEKSQNMDLDFSNDKCIDDVNEVPNVSVNRNDNFDSPTESEESEHSDILPTADVPNILDTNKVDYAKENYSTDLVDSECSSPYSHVNVEELSAIHDIVAEETAYDSDRYSYLPEEELKEIGDGIFHSTEARVFSYSSGDETGLNNPETEPVAGVVGRNDCGVLTEETHFEDTEIESANPDDVNINDGKALMTDFKEFEEKEGNVFYTLENHEDSKESEEKEENGLVMVENLEHSKESEEKEGHGCFILVSSEEKEGNGRFTLNNSKVSKNSGEKDGTSRFTFENCESEESEEKVGNVCFTLVDPEDSEESEEKRGNGYFTHVEDSEESEENEGNGRFTLENREGSEKSEEKEGNGPFTHHEDSEESEEKERDGSFTLVDREDSVESEDKEGSDRLTLENREDSKKSEEKEGNCCFTRGEDSEESEEKEGNGCFTLVDRKDSEESEEKDANGYFTHLEDSDEYEEKEVNGRFTPESREYSEKSEEKEENSCFTHHEDSEESEEKEGSSGFTFVDRDDSEKSEEKEANDYFTHLDDSAESEEKEGKDHFTLENREDSEKSEEKEGNGCFTMDNREESENSEEKKVNGCFTFVDREDSEESENKEGTGCFILENREDSEESEEKQGSGYFTIEHREDSKDSEEKEGNGRVTLENSEDSTESEEKDGNGGVDDNPSLTSKIIEDQIPSLSAKTDQNQQPVLHDLDSQPINISPSDISYVENKIDQTLNDQIDISEAKYDHLKSQQLHVDSLTHIDHGALPINSNLQESTHECDQVKLQSSPVHSGFSLLSQAPPVKPEEMPPLPPLPPMQWRMRKLQNSLLTPTDGGQHSDNPFPPLFPSAPIDTPQVVTRSIVEDEIQNMDTETSDEMAPKAVVESSPTSEQEVFWPSSLPPDVNEMQNTIRPMKIQRPRSPLIDAVAAHDKTKLRKVSDRSTNQMSKRDERDALLDQIRAKSFNLKPAIKPRPSIQGPKTNLRVAAILEKANAIRQAFAGSDDENDDSDNWSDS